MTYGAGTDFLLPQSLSPAPWRHGSRHPIHTGGGRAARHNHDIDSIRKGSSTVERAAHNGSDAGSNPAPSTKCESPTSPTAPEGPHDA